LSFAEDVRYAPTLFAWRGKLIKHRTAIFRQINKEKAATHHDALEFPDGQIVLLTSLVNNQHALILQLPAASKATSFAAHSRLSSQMI
jgi:hypothetical protein